MKKTWLAWAILGCIGLMLCPRVQGSAPKYMALTFDDGPSGAITTALLDGLEQRGIRATFFLCGYRMELYPQVTARLVQGGHELGLHGYSHDSMKDMSRQTLEEELAKTQRLFLEQTGEEARLLRPPGGCCSDTLRTVAREQGLELVFWDLDTKDWATRHADTVRDRLVAQARDGAVVLLHDMWPSSVEGALAAVDVLQAQGYRFVTLSELRACGRQCRLTNLCARYGTGRRTGPQGHIPAQGCSPGFSGTPGQLLLPSCGNSPSGGTPPYEAPSRPTGTIHRPNLSPKYQNKY